MEGDALDPSITIKDEPSDANKLLPEGWELIASRMTSKDWARARCAHPAMLKARVDIVRAKPLNTSELARIARDVPTAKTLWLDLTSLTSSSSLFSKIWRQNVADLGHLQHLSLVLSSKAHTHRQGPAQRGESLSSWTAALGDVLASAHSLTVLRLNVADEKTAASEPPQRQAAFTGDLPLAGTPDQPADPQPRAEPRRQPGDSLRGTAARSVSLPAAALNHPLPHDTRGPQRAREMRGYGVDRPPVPEAVLGGHLQHFMLRMQCFCPQSPAGPVDFLCGHVCSVSGQPVSASHRAAADSQRPAEPDRQPVAAAGAGRPHRAKSACLPRPPGTSS